MRITSLFEDDVMVQLTILGTLRRKLLYWLRPRLKEGETVIILRMRQCGHEIGYELKPIELNVSRSQSLDEDTVHIEAVLR